MQLSPARRLVPLTLLAGLLSLAACQKPLAVVADAPPLPPHLGPPPAAMCTVAPFHVTDGGTAAVSMVISNDGGFCAAALTAGNGAPFDAPLVPSRPSHGAQTVVRYNGKTSIEYAALAGYVGHDSFTVHLILRGQPGYTTVNVSVDVQPRAAAAPAKTS